MMIEYFFSFQIHFTKTCIIASISNEFMRMNLRFLNNLFTIIMTCRKRLSLRTHTSSDVMKSTFMFCQYLFDIDNDFSKSCFFSRYVLMRLHE